jgi:hypothetical protein
MDTLEIAIRETRKLQNDEIKGGHLNFAPPADPIEMLDFWLKRIMDRRYLPRGPSKREVRVEGLIYAALAEAQRAQA